MTILDESVVPAVFVLLVIVGYGCRPTFWNLHLAPRTSSIYSLLAYPLLDMLDGTEFTIQDGHWS